MAALVEVKVARDQGIFLEPSLRETKAAVPPSHVEDREKKEHADGEVKEKEYIPLHVARDKIITLQDELRNMKRRHIVVIEAMQKEFGDRDNESRDAYNAVLNQAKEQAKTRIHVHKTRGEKFRTELQRERTERERQYKESQERLSENKARIDGLDRIIIELKAALEKHKDQLKNAKSDSETLNKQVEDHRRDARLAGGDLNAMTEERDRMRRTRDEHEAELERLNDRHREHESKIREYEARIDVMSREKNDASSTGATLAREDEELLRRQLAEAQAALKSARPKGSSSSSSSTTVVVSTGNESADELRAQLLATQQDLDEISQLLDQQEEEPGNSPRSELAKRLREALRHARQDLGQARLAREHMDTDGKEEVVIVGEDPAITARRRELLSQIARLLSQIEAMRHTLSGRVSGLETKEAELAPMSAEVKRLFDIAKPLDEERARLLATYRLLQDNDGKQVAFGPSEVASLARLNIINEQIVSIRSVIEPIFRDLKEKDKNEKERERIKASFAALKDEMKQKKDAGDDDGAAAIKERALAEKKEYEGLGAWLAAYPARREEFDTKKAEMTALESERQSMMITVFRFAWMRQNGEEKIVLRPPATDDLKRLGEIYGHRSRFTEAKAAMDPLKKQVDVQRSEVANERTALTTCEDELKKLQAELDGLPAAPQPTTTKSSAKSSSVAPKSSTSSSSTSRVTTTITTGGMDPAAVARMEREAAADKKAALDKQRTASDIQIHELTERIRKLEKIIDDMRDGDTDSRLRVLDQQLKDERMTYEAKIVALQQSSSGGDKQLDDMKKHMNTEIARLTESLRKAEENLRNRPAVTATASKSGASTPNPSTPNPSGITGGKFGADPAILAAAEEKVAVAEAKVAEINTEIARIRGELDDAQSAKRKADDHAAELQNRIDAFGAKEAPLMTNVAIKELQRQSHHIKDELDAETKKAHSLEGQLHVKTDELAAAVADVALLKAQIDTLNSNHSTEITELKEQADKLSADAKQSFNEMETNLTAASDKRAADLTSSHDARVAELDAEIADLKSKLTTSEARASDLDGKLTAETSLRESTQQSLASLTSTHESLVTVHAICDGKITALTTETNERKEIMDKQAADNKELVDQVAFMKLRVAEEQDRRKKLQFELEDAKGKIRVYARVRPFSKTELENKEDDAVRLGANNWSLELHWPEFGADGGLRKDTWLPFTFDAVFHPKLGGATQDQVFEECRAFVELAQNGVNTCIFCYGQSGTGKTFTMSGVSGPDKDPALRGLKPRAIHYIFETAKKNAQTHEYTVKAYAVEVFNDTLNDVFWKHSRFMATKSEKPSKWGAPPTLDLKNEIDPKTKAVKRVRIDGIMEHEFKDPDEMVAFLDAAEVRRATRATALNPVSSRSHLIFAITITTKVIAGKDKGKTYTGKISLCDLAGSERPSKAEVAGLPPAEQAALTEEGKHINMSLSNLRLVFEKLGSQDKKTIIDYTQSTLTKVMRDSLGGNSKALMFVNLGPAQSNQNESKDSLGFGKLVSNIVTQQKASVDSDNSEQIKNLQFRLEQYEKKFGAL